MKLKHKVTILALAALVTGTSHAAITGKSSGFMDKRQLAAWRAEAASNVAVKKDDESAFFTGRAYLEATDTYAYKFRAYDPSVARWTTEDPSGFPDGTNNNIYVNNRTLTWYDDQGLSGVYVDYYKYNLELTRFFSWGDLALFAGGGIVGGGTVGAGVGAAAGLGVGSIPGAVIGAAGGALIGGPSAAVARANSAYTGFINDNMAAYPIGDSSNPGTIVHTATRYSAHDLTQTGIESSITSVGNWDWEWDARGIKFTGLVTSFKTPRYE